VALVWLLVAGYSPMRVGFYAIVAVVAAAAARRSGPSPPPARPPGFAALCRRGFALTLEALELGARNAVAVSMACAVAGIIVGVVGLTGLGLKFSAMMIAFSGGNIVLALILVLLASLVLGMGLPVTAAYIVLIILVGPGADRGIRRAAADRASGGVLVLAGQQRDAAGGARGLCGRGHRRLEADGDEPRRRGSTPRASISSRSSWSSTRRSSSAARCRYLIWTGAIAILALVAFAAALEGFLWAPMPLWQRLLVIPGVVGIFWPDFRWEIAGAALLALAPALNWASGRRRARAARLTPRRRKGEMARGTRASAGFTR
jgi:TRAP-type uncharacterized transport system fused permease subunit